MQKHFTPHPMNIFTKKTSWSGWEIGTIKFTVLCFALAIGANWPQYIVPYTWYLVALGAIAGIWSMSIWIRGLRR